ncbi:hypothetical protein OG413_40745 [Streptomyces sp. NBC_01433]|uniref:hypothetical protein n=1 Tax=Streptomyces sp. NBC_01433 TaxID=2903864 RepID=UPI002257D2F5|nr:hypothetical protein [Streptomyces sp. NBC_01433]MCX4681531.1 hypothetical protein [Streptomyces sp. NBC_01433]
MQMAHQSDRPWGGFVRIDARATVGTEPGSVLVVCLSRHDPGPEPEPSETLLTMFLTAVDASPFEDSGGKAAYLRGSQTSPAVAAWVQKDEAPELVVDKIMSNLVVVNTAGALIDDRTCRVGLRSTFEQVDNRDGVLLTMTSETADAPVELFPALLYCWLSWWRQQDLALRGGSEAPPPTTGNVEADAGQLAAWILRAAELHRRRPPQRVNVPLPPERLDLIENGRRFTVRLSDFEFTTWPDLPPRRNRDRYSDDPDM